MTREELRQQIVDGDQRLQNSVAWRWLSDEQKKLVLIGMAFWQDTNDSVTTAALDDFLARYSKMEVHFHEDFKPGEEQLTALGVDYGTYMRVAKHALGF